MNTRSKKKRIEIIFLNSYSNPESAHWTIPLTGSEQVQTETKKDRRQRTLYIKGLFAADPTMLQEISCHRYPALERIDLEGSPFPEYQ